MRSLWAALLLAGTVLSACTSAPRSQSASAELGVRVLAADEIAAAHVATAYQAVTALRPQFLRWTRGPEDELHRLVVYLDGIRVGGVEELERIPALSVSQIRFLTAWKASALYGPGHPLGALDVRTSAGWR
ncbi:MAG: hypothetical protein ACRELD_11795 [Longimicrobiales bacterium]